MSITDIKTREAARKIIGIIGNVKEAGLFKYTDDVLKAARDMYMTNADISSAMSFMRKKKLIESSQTTKKDGRSIIRLTKEGRDYNP